MTISKKLFTSLGVLVAIVLIMGGCAIRSIGKLGDSVHELGNHYTRSNFLAGDINNATTELLSTSRAIMSRGYQKDPEKAGVYNAHYADLVAQIRRDGAEILAGTHSSRVSDIMQTGILDKLDAEAQANSDLYGYVIKGDMVGAIAPYNDRVLPLSKAIAHSGQDLATLENQLSGAKSEEDDKLVAPARDVSIMMIILSLVVSATVVYIVRDISKHLNNSITELRDGAEQVANAASQVSSSSQSLAQGASEQAASLEETSASSEEINSMARKNTDNSRCTVELLSQSQAKVTLANRYLAEMVTSMSEIAESSGKISKIIRVIDEIAFQTNILALNAAVEAARAGEAGMGFAVVADEVRSLAQRSAQAAKDTATLIEESIARSREGKGKVDQVALAIQAITEETARIKVMVDEVSLGSEEQSRGIDQIGRAIAQMEQVTQATAASAEECAASAEELNAQSEAMRDSVAHLFAMVEGVKAVPQGEVSGMVRRTASLGDTGFPGRVGKPRSHPMFPQMARSSMEMSHKTGVTSAHPAMNEFPLGEQFQSF
jgi:methyl-accepting chemotaxis protein/methyl-accepting chemotaxis protein-1 (serine sensor receptor)